ncbi:unannotated protein [freshwater metagenome]|uniref:Unannotated protein n=1 Tax=freshwater metagenome TaxID=449393 RepID=A0A6J7RZN0_9ZZZZ
MRLKWCTLGISRGWNGLFDDVEEHLKIGLFWHTAISSLGERGATRLGRCINNGEFNLLLVRIKIEEEFISLVENFGDTSIRTINFVDNQDDRKFFRERFTQHKTGLWKWAFRGIHQEEHTVNHFESAFYFATEVGVAWGVDDVNGHVTTLHRRVFCENSDALFALEIHGIHHTILAFALFLVSSESTGLPKHCINECRLTMIDVGDNSYVS